MKLQLYNTVLYLGDAYKLLPEIGAVDAMVTDPQYEFDASGGGIFRRNRRNMDDIEDAGLNKGFDSDIFKSGLYGTIVTFCHNNQLPKILPILDNVFHRCVLCAWEKTNPMPVANKNYQPDIEPYVHAWHKGFAPTGELVDKKRIIRTTNGKSKWGHPTVKPDVVMDKIMRNVAGDTVIDPFMGSGSTGVAAIKAGKRFTGIESNPKFFNIAVVRILAAYGHKVP